MERLGDALARLKIRERILQVSTGTSSDADLAADEPSTCARCRGAGYLRHDVPAGHPDFGRPVPCPCRADELQALRRSRLQRLSNLGSLTRLTFANLQPEGRTDDPIRRDRYRRVVEQARRFAEEPSDWMLLTGPPGCGKTHIAAAIANVRLTASKSAMFVVVPDLLDHLRATFAPKSEIGYDELFTNVRDTPLLILDDLGTQASTEWAQEKLYQLVNHRYNSRLPTVITTNLRPEELDERLGTRLLDPALTALLIVDDWEATALQRLGGMTLERLREMKFETFDQRGMTATAEQRANVRKIYQYASEYADRPVGWFVLLGISGTGKTHLAASIANARNADRYPAHFVTAPDLLDHLRAAYAPDSKLSYDKVFEAIRSAPLLILDDLGAHSSTAWAEEKLYQLLNYRYNAKLPTVVTSNLDIDRMDPRIASRLMDQQLSTVWSLQIPPYRGIQSASPNPPTSLDRRRPRRPASRWRDQPDGSGST